MSSSALVASARIRRHEYGRPGGPAGQSARQRRRDCDQPPHPYDEKGDRMAWLTLADATGAIEAAVFPQAFERLTETSNGEFPLGEGAFLVARERLSQEEATGSKLFAD